MQRTAKEMGDEICISFTFRDEGGGLYSSPFRSTPDNHNFTGTQERAFNPAKVLIMGFFSLLDTKIDPTYNAAQGIAGSC